jgi:CRISPR system Cascade subunit CasE
MSAPLYLTRARLRTGRGEQLSAIAPSLLRGSKGDTVGHAHRILWMLFRDRAEGDVRDFLWREEKPGHYLVLSKRFPTDESHLFDVNTKDYDPQLKAGDRLAFTLRANPVVSRKAEGARCNKRDGKGRIRGARCDIVMDALKPLSQRNPDNKRGESERARNRENFTQIAARDWLTKQGEKHGFRLVDGFATNYETIQIPRGKQHAESGEWRLESRSRFAQFGVLDLSGMIEITDAAAFLAQLPEGFGKAKAFGCGLMLIKRAA